MKSKIFLILILFCTFVFAIEYEYTDRIKEPFTKDLKYGKITSLKEPEKIDPLFFSMGCFGTDDDEDPDGFVIHKFGRAENLPSATWATMYDNAENLNIYPKLDTAETMYIVSDDATETAEIKVYYLDASFERKNKTVTCNGTTNVLVADDIMRPYRMQVTSSSNASGNITLVDSEDVVYAKIIDSGEDFNQTQMAVYTVPLGYTALIFSINAGAGSGKEIELHYKAQPFGEANKTKIPLMIYQTNYTENFKVPFVFPEKTYIEVRAKAGGAGITGTARWTMMLLKNEIYCEVCDKIKF